jgi:hypothetical protein
VLLAIGTLVAAGLVLSSAWYLVRPYLGPSARARTAAVALTSLVLALLNATPVQTLLASAIVGAAWPWPPAGPDDATDREPRSAGLPDSAR